MTFDFVIPNYNQSGILFECIDSIRRFHDDKIIVVDDGSNDLTRKNISKINNDGVVLHLSDFNMGFGKACNKGFELSDSDAVVLINNDVVLEKPILEEVENILNRDKTIDIIGFLLYYPNGYIQHGGHQLVNNRFHFIHQDYQAHPKKAKQAFNSRYILSVTGALMVIRKSFIEKFGGFGDNYKNCFEDTELCLRAWANDRRVYYTSNVYATHREGFTRGVTPEEKKALGFWAGEVESYRQYDKDVKRYDVDVFIKKVEEANDSWNK
jgi:O-antigen biosynthesis protein